MESQSTQIQQFIESLHEQLAAVQMDGVVPPLLRRKLRTVLNGCEYAAAKRTVLANLQDAFKRGGIYTEPALTQRGLRQDDWIVFSNGPFPPDAAYFSTERDLQRFLAASVGTGPLRHLRLIKAEWRLPSRRRVDLLCEEVVSGGLAPLVAVELKREESPRGVVEQLVEYIDELRRFYPDRKIKGLIVSGREDQVGVSILRRYPEYDVEWYCYRVELERAVPVSA